MKEDSIIIVSNNITLMLENNDGFPAERKELYLKAFCDVLSAVDKDQLWDIYALIFNDALNAFTKRFPNTNAKVSE